jgi:hypothetical protein
MFKLFTRVKPENKENIPIKSKTFLKSVDVFICTGKDLIYFKYRNGEWKKYINERLGIKASGDTYEEFINNVLFNYPLDSVKSFRLVDINK